MFCVFNLVFPALFSLSFVKVRESHFLIPFPDVLDAFFFFFLSLSSFVICGSFCVFSKSHRSLDQPHVGIGIGSVHSFKLDIVLLFLLLLIVHLLLSEAGFNLQLAQPPPHVVSLEVLPPHQRSGGVHLEAVDAGDVPFNAFGGDEGGVDLEDDVVKGGAEVGAVDGGVARGFGVVEVLAAGAVELDRLEIGNIGEAHGEQGVRVTVDAGTFAKLGLFVLVEL